MIHEFTKVIKCFKSNQKTNRNFTMPNSDIGSISFNMIKNLYQKNYYLFKSLGQKNIIHAASMQIL